MPRTYFGTQSTPTAKNGADIGLSPADKAGVVAMLNAALADLYVLYTKTRNCHWNVTGPRFNDLHKFFEAQYEALDESIDQVAEFVRYMGERVPASLAVFKKNARLSEDENPSMSAESMVSMLLKDHESVIKALRADAADADTKFKAEEVVNFLSGLMEGHEKMAWMLRAMGE